MASSGVRPGSGGEGVRAGAGGTGAVSGPSTPLDGQSGVAAWAADHESDVAYLFPLSDTEPSNTVLDVGPNSMVGTTEQSAILGGIEGQPCAEFINLTTSRITVPYSAVLNTIVAGFCVAQFDNVTGFQFLPHRDDNTGSRSYQWRTSGGEIQFVKIAGGVTTVSTSGLGLQANVPYTFGWWWDGANIHLYVDGVEVRSAPCGDFYTGSPNSKMEMGMSSGGGGNTDGVIGAVMGLTSADATTIPALHSAWGSPTPQTLSEAILDRSPYGYWKLDETSGTTAIDSSGNGRNGTYNGLITKSNVLGPDGTSYPTFNGGRVTIPDADVWSLGASSGLTFFALIKPFSVSSGRSFIVSKGAASNYEWEFSVNDGAGGRLTALSYSFGGSNRSEAYYHQSISGITTDWNAVAARIPDNTVNSDIELYSNSTTDGATHVTRSGTPYANGSAAVNIANRADSPSGQFFRGELAHVAIFDESVDLAPIIAAAIAGGWT